MAPTTVRKETTSVSRQYHGVQPLDVRFYTPYGLSGVDVTITGTSQTAQLTSTDSKQPPLKKIEGHTMIRDLLENQIYLLPGTINLSIRLLEVKGLKGTESVYLINGT
eukprot:6635137-Ditylum_brightwellii.AAC.1